MQEIDGNGLRLKDFDMDYYSSDIGTMLTNSSRDFVELEYGRGFDQYIKRIENLGLTGFSSVLDAGGGIGNWAMPLSALNSKVEVVDLSAERLMVGRLMADKLRIRNVKFTNASIDKLPHQNEAFDAVICYSVIMFTDVQKTLREFHRVLKQGGRLYVMVDLWRWYFGDGLPPVGHVKHFAKLLRSKMLYNSPTLLTSRSFEQTVARAGFSIVSRGQDGRTSFLENEAVDAESFYPSYPVGREQLWEICALKD